MKFTDPDADGDCAASTRQNCYNDGFDDDDEYHVDAAVNFHIGEKLGGSDSCGELGSGDDGSNSNTAVDDEPTAFGATCLLDRSHAGRLISLKL